MVSSDPVDLQLLDRVAVLAFTDEYCHLEKLSSRIEITQGVLGIGSGGCMVDLKGAGSVRREERLQDLLGLVAARVIRGRHDRDLKIIGEPGGQALRVPASKVLGDGHENIIAVRSRPCGKTEQQHR